MVQCRSGICVDCYNARTLDDGIRYYRVSGHGSVLIMEVLTGIEFGRNLNGRRNNEFGDALFAMAQGAWVGYLCLSAIK